MVKMNIERARLIGEFLRQREVGPPLNFSGDDGKFPALNHPAALDFFFAVVMQDYGFWRGDANGYIEPIFAHAGGKRLKGSDFLWTVSKRMLDTDPDLFHPIRLAVLPRDTLRAWMADDEGRVPFPDAGSTRLNRIARAYGAWMIANGKTPAEIVYEARCSANPLGAFLQSLREIPGYAGDPLEKKATLLAMALANRPEQFLPVTPEDPAWRPIIDYHLMRLALRTGGVDPGRWRPYVTERCVKPTRAGEIKVPYIPAEGESEIRNATYEFFQELIRASGKTMAEVDNFAWSARRYCPEMEVPNCAACPLAAVCEKRIELFQPVQRTTLY